ncbi:hypothetical protein HC931_23020 [Candidatus Gracilibacteria bacterium]|nr:hypothetical protein [Candidatus Gracilibacteria bacterium]NJM88297.1 hypothetical protein [Hydrococcus sp. RU_2_2]NJP18024.1 hypothetical protein [Hydrococcus sp. CRU_1_1]
MISSSEQQQKFIIKLPAIAVAGFYYCSCAIAIGIQARPNILLIFP